MGRFGWPLPRAIVFEDRSTGTLYLLSHDSATDEIILTTPVPSRARARPEEPTLRSPIGLIRLFVEGGELMYEAVEEPDNERRQDEPVFTLNYSDRRTTYEIHASGLVVFGGPLCLKRYDGLGQTTVITDLGCILDLLFGGIPGTVVFEVGVFEEGVFVS